MKVSRIQLLAALVAGFSFGSCSLPSFSKQVKVNHPIQTTDSGLKFQDTLEGLGPVVTPTSEVTLDYRVTLTDQTVVDSTYDRGQALTFPMGSAPILGWEEALLGMRAGGHRVAEIPPALGYGEEGIEGLVPPHSTLLCEFEMIEVAEPRRE